jgi:hypothetical protein
LAKNSSLGFAKGLACVSGKTKCAVCALAIQNILHSGKKNLNTEGSAMSVFLLPVRLLHRFYACVHLSKWFTFNSFNFAYVCCVVVFLRFLVTAEYL